MSDALHCLFASTDNADADHAVAEIARAVTQTDMACVVVYCSPDYYPPTLGASLSLAFDCPVLACTVAGQMGPRGFRHKGLTAVSMSSAHLTVRPYIIEPLAECETRALVVSERVRIDNLARLSGWRSFGVLLTDGRSVMEERLTATLFHGLDELPIVGGSAGDSDHAAESHVYWDGEMRTGVAVFAVFDTDLPFETFLNHSVVSGPNRVVVTAADTRQRLVHELDGLPAAEVYARYVGCEVDALGAEVFDRHPLVLSVGGATFPRSPARVEPDLSLRFRCSVQEGLVLAIGDAGDGAEALRATSARLALRRPELVLGFDCGIGHASRAEARASTALGAELAARNVVGFSTHGEQFNAVHVNHAFVGVAIGVVP